jgi:NSS family neurotransmitter:Na+ symporter
MLDDNIPQPWRARTTLVLTLTLVAVGLGNLQRLPFLMGEHGGAPFFLSYVAALMLMSAPVLIAEVVIGSLGRGSPGLALHWAASAASVDSRWRFLGVAQAVLSLILATVAALSAVWCWHWAGALYSGALASASANDVAAAFTAFVSDRPAQFMLVLAALGAAGALSAVGIRAGMGLLAWGCLPVVAVTLLGVLDFVFVHADLRPVEEFLFSRQSSEWSLNSFWQALGAAGITLGAGVGVGLALGAQAPTGLPWARSVLAVAVLDTAFMVITAVILSALLFEANVAPVQGLAAVFIGLPYAFANLPLGETYGALLFAALALVSWSASVVLLEPVVMLIDSEWGLGRVSGAVLTATLAIIVAAVSLFASEAPLIQLGSLATQWLLPASVLALSIFVGWLMPRPVLRGELYREPLWLFRFWWWALRWLVPPASVLWFMWGSA